MRVGGTYEHPDVEVEVKRSGSRVGANANGGGATATELVEGSAKQCLCEPLVSVVTANG